MNLGQQEIPVVTDEGLDYVTTFQVAEVTRPLTPVSKMCDKGNLVIFGRKGGIIRNIHSGREVRFERRGGTFELNLWMEEGALPSFSRHGS